MKNQEKDLKNAREFKRSYQKFNMHRPVYQDMIQMLSDYVQWLEQKGVIKFTENRNSGCSDEILQTDDKCGEDFKSSLCGCGSLRNNMTTHYCRVNI